MLSGATPLTKATVLERMAIERVVTAWLAVQQIDGIVAKSVGGTLPQGHFQLRQGPHRHKRRQSDVLDFKRYSFG
jgi:hypothetical protein